MKRHLFALLTALVAMGSLSTVASAQQVGSHNLDADLNGDGEVSLIELNLYNLDQRQN